MADALILARVPAVLEARHQRVVSGELIVQTRTDGGSRVGRHHGLLYARLQEGVRVHVDRVNQRVIGDLAAIEIEEVTGALAERAADVTAEHTAGKIRLVCGERVARVEYSITVVESQTAANFVAARLGKNFDAAETELVVFGGEGVLIDANFADGFLGRELTAAEAVDVNRAAIGSGAGPGERLKGVGEIVGIVGERGQIFAAQHQRGGVVIGFHAESCSGLLGDGNLLLLGGQHQLDGHYKIASGGDIDRLADGRETWERDLDGVRSGCQPLKNVASIDLGLRGLGDALANERNVGGGDDTARIVGHGTAQGAGSGLSHRTRYD